MAEEPGKEPGNWELYRGIERVETALKEIASNSLSASVFAIEKAAILLQIASVNEKQVEAAAQAKQDRDELDAYKKDIEDQKGKNRLFVYGLFGGPLAVALIGWLLTGGLR